MDDKSVYCQEHSGCMDSFVGNQLSGSGADRLWRLIKMNWYATGRSIDGGRR